MVMSFPTFPKDAYDFSSADVGQALAGLIARDGAGMPVEGMLAAPSVAAVPAAWKVRVGRFVHVSHVSGAVRFSGVKADTDADIAPAAGIPAGQARIDRIGWDVAAEALTVLTGTAASSPDAPALGALKPVARVRVDAGDGMVVASKVTPEFTQTGLAGAAGGTYTPVVSGYVPGFAPAMRAQFTRSGDVYDVEVQAETDREANKFDGVLFVTTPVPIGANQIAVDGGGYFLAGPPAARRLYEAKVRQGSASQVVVEIVRVDGRLAEMVSIPSAGFAATDLVSWRVRFRFTAS